MNTFEEMPENLDDEYIEQHSERFKYETIFNNTALDDFIEADIQSIRDTKEIDERKNQIKNLKDKIQNFIGVDDEYMVMSYIEEKIAY